MQSRLIEFLEIINIFFSRSIYFLYFNIQYRNLRPHRRCETGRNMKYYLDIFAIPDSLQSFAII